MEALINELNNFDVEYVIKGFYVEAYFLTATLKPLVKRFRTLTGLNKFIASKEK